MTQWALENGDAPALILDENSPIRDAMREALKPQAPPAAVDVTFTEWFGEDKFPDDDQPVGESLTPALRRLFRRQGWDAACASDRNPQGGDADAAPGRSPESAVRRTRPEDRADGADQSNSGETTPHQPAKDQT